MYKGINTWEEHKFVCPEDPDPQDPTVFFVSALDSHVEAYIEDQTTDFSFDPNNPNDEGKLKVLTALRNVLRVKFGLKRMHNFIHPVENKPVVIEHETVTIAGINYKVVPDKVLAMFDKVLIHHLAAEIQKCAHLTVEQKKT